MEVRRAFLVGDTLAGGFLVNGLEVVDFYLREGDTVTLATGFYKSKTEARQDIKRFLEGEDDVGQS